MNRNLSTHLMLALSLVAGLACGPGFCQGDPEFKGGCETKMDQDTQTLSKTQGGLLHLMIPSAFGKGPVLLNQPSTTQYYVLGKLVQPGIASLDLILTHDSKSGDYEAQVDPLDLQTFHLGPAEVQLTTPDGGITKPLTLD